MAKKNNINLSFEHPLPHEVSLHIFSFLTHPNDIAHLREINSEFKQLAGDDFLWRRFLPKQDQKQSHAMKLFANYVTHLEKRYSPQFIKENASVIEKCQENRPLTVLLLGSKERKKRCIPENNSPFEHMLIESSDFKIAKIKNRHLNIYPEDYQHRLHRQRLMLKRADIIVICATSNEEAKQNIQIIQEATPIGTEKTALIILLNFNDLSEELKEQYFVVNDTKNPEKILERIVDITALDTKPHAEKTTSRRSPNKKCIIG